MVWTYTECRHGLCNAHYERELVAVEENTHQTWARALIAHLQTIKKAVAAAVAAGHRLNTGRADGFRCDL